MRFASSFSAAILALGFSTSAASLEIRQATLLPFEVTNIVTSSPPGRPGSTPWSYIRANFTDPNSYSFTQGTHNGTVPAGLQGINCEARWYRGESPVGRTWPCNSVEQGHFALQVFPGTGASAYVNDFELKFIHGVEPEAPISNIFERFEANGSFNSADNLNGRCSSGGNCNYSLKPAREYHLQQIKSVIGTNDCAIHSEASLAPSHRNGSSNRLKHPTPCLRKSTWLESGVARFTSPLLLQTTMYYIDHSHTEGAQYQLRTSSRYQWPSKQNEMIYSG
ncbi:hypothetical protein BU25DRAFT_425580 [Macroventuria anomochaeta]|uniref:Uncharacterized protein n=1 Tax=Macroventuria anomochaeta TaxID=301207 RepID=A0ACB6RL07_9PLEO|nr:uncharacterized protein BU25DRAFT_425580 [Macroventuria anomochaeta]KAF2622640.1 hypothetical protein BU25DRAFT_425580 [Macroventuria anomochaeta]